MLKGVKNMGIFNKKSHDNYDDGHNHELLNDDFFISGEDDITPWIKRKSKISAPHALTPDEVLHNNPEEIEMKGGSHPQPESVYKRMKEQEKKTAEKGFDDDYVPSWAKNEQDKGKQEEKATVLPKAKPQPQLEVRKQPEIIHPSSDFLERCKIAVNIATGVAEPEKVSAVPSDKKAEDHETKAKTVTLEENSVEADAEVKKSDKIDADEILRKLRRESPVSKSDEATDDKEKKAEVVVEKADIEEIKLVSQNDVIDEDTIDEDATDGAKVTKTEQVVCAVAEELDEADDDIVEDISDEAETDEAGHRRVEVEVEVIPMDAPSEIMHTDESDVRVYRKEVNADVAGSDAHDEADISETIIIKKEELENEKTIMFDNLESIIADKADSEFENASQDYDEDEEYDDMPYYEAVDHDLDGIDDYRSLNDAARLRTAYMEQGTKSTVCLVFSAAATVIAAISSLFSTTFGSKAVAVIGLILLAVTMITNYTVFTDLKKMINGKPSFDSCAAITSIATFLQGVICIAFGKPEYVNVAAAATLTLTFAVFIKRLKISRILKGLERIGNSEEKRAVVSVERNTGNTIASGAVDGEALVLCGKSTENIRDYVKNSNYLSPFDLKINVLLIVGGLIAVFVGAVTWFIGSFLSGLTLAVLVLCAVYPVSAALTCELPMYFATKRALRYGAILAGYKGAYELNLANTIAVKTSDLFPDGTVKLYNMKPLGNNDIGECLIDAAAVALSAKSPISSILRDIVGDVPADKMPKVNGVQYEDKMGVSGWIGEKTILIGNRNLMQGHNIEVPPLSVDKKILQAGYFPVYIASNGVPSLLFVVKYETDPNITSELQRLCNTGMTVVVDPEDPNPTDLMLCNYFGLPNDALKVMNHNGRTVYERTTAYTENSTASAGFTKSVCGFFSAVTSAIKLPGIYMALTVLFVIAAVLGVITLVFMSVTGKMNMINSFTVSVYQLFFAGVAALVAKIKSR